MRNIYMGVVAFLVLLLVITITFTWESKSARKQETTLSIEAAMEAAGENLNKEAFTSDESLEAAFIENLLLQFNSTSDVDITILKADADKGLISAEVTQTFAYIGGKEGKVSCTRTMILEVDEKEEEKPKYEVSYYLDSSLDEGSLYKTIIVTEGELLHAPQVPEKEKSTFAYWVNANNHTQYTFNQEIHNNVVLYAKWQ